MKEFLKTFFSYNFFKVFIYFIFVFSGLLKWIPFPIDITIASALICVLIILLEVGTIVKFSRTDRINIYFIFALLFLFVFSNLYTISTVYSEQKSLAIVLNFFAVIYPIIVLKQSVFKELTYLMYIAGSVICLILFYFYQQDMFVVLFFDESQALENVPTYLAIGILLSGCIIFSLTSRITLLSLIYQCLAIFLLVQLGGRGPLLNLSICLLIYFFLSVHKFKLKPRTVFFITALWIGSLVFLQDILDYVLSNLNLDRFNLLKASGEDGSFLVRFRFIHDAWNSFLDKPLIGHGIGSGGIILRGQDVREFPHNLLIESLMELGILGGLLFLSIYLIFIIKNFQLAKKDKAFTVLYVVVILFFLEDNKSGSFDSWRIALFWVMMFIVEKNNFLRGLKTRK